jgi:hypothetical protein
MLTMDQLFDWSDITYDSECRPRSMPLTSRNGNDVFLIIHHAYNLKVQDTIALSKPGGKQVSMNGALGPTVARVTAPIYDVQVVPWNTHRAYTTASWIDDQAFTYETSNIDLNSPYPVAQEAKQKIAARAAAMHVQLGMPLDHWHITDHAGVYARGWDSYPTACCGDDLRAAIDWIIAEAMRIVAGTPVPVDPFKKARESENEMYVRLDPTVYGFDLSVNPVYEKWRNPATGKKELLLLEHYDAAGAASLAVPHDWGTLDGLAGELGYAGLTEPAILTADETAEPGNS